MNEATANIIDLLNRSELDLGADTFDQELIADPEALRQRVAELLVQPPIWISAEYAGSLRDSVLQADWPIVAEEMKRRIEAADTLQAGSVGQRLTGNPPYSTAAR